MEWIFDGPREGGVITNDIRESLTDSEQLRRGFP